MNTNEIYRVIFTFTGAVVAFLEPTLPYILICTLLIFADCYTAWQLSRRARKMFPDKVGKDGGKFKSRHFGEVLHTLLKSYALIIIAFLMHHYITDGLSFDLTKICTMAICFWQIWSILENESSCNNASWAKIAQKILMDKTSRHFDIDLTDLKES